MSLRTHLAPTPPMGWNSYDSYGCAITEAEFRANAAALAQRLRPHGYEYACIDAAWYHDSVEPTALASVARGDAGPSMDSFGRLLPSPVRFPSAAGGAGFKPLADFVHGKGLKFGIHIMRGVPRAAVAANMPIAGSPYRARDIANTANRCPWEHTMFGVDMTKPGAQAWYDSLVALYAEWEVDFIKADDMCHPYFHAEIAALYQAIERCPRPILLSLSPGVDINDILRAHPHVREHCEMWRISADVWDKWQDVRQLFVLSAVWGAASVQGAWPDADMLPYGKVGLGEKPSQPTRTSRLTDDEMRTHFTLLAMMRSPLFFGGDVPQLDAATLAVLTHPEILAVHQHGAQTQQLHIWGRSDRAVARSAVDSRTGEPILALFNLDDAPAELSATLEELGLQGAARPRDLWARKDLAVVRERVSVRLAPHACAVYRLTPVAIS